MTKEEAIKILSNRDGHGIPSGYNGGYAEAIEVAIEALKAEPRKHGRWLKTGQSLVYPNKFRNYFCSICGIELDAHIRQEPNYCPNCGAKMDERREDADN